MTTDQTINAIVRNGYAQQKFFLDDGRPMSVVTIPMSVFKALGRAKCLKAIRSWQSGEEIRARQAQVAAWIRAGKPVSEIAELTGLTVQRIYQIKKSLESKNPTTTRKKMESA